MDASQKGLLAKNGTLQHLTYTTNPTRIASGKWKIAISSSATFNPKKRRHVETFRLIVTAQACLVAETYTPLCINVFHFPFIQQHSLTLESNYENNPLIFFKNPSSRAVSLGLWSLASSS